MRDPKQRYLIIEQGSTLKQWFRVKNPLTGTTYDLVAEGYDTAALQIRDAFASDDGQLVLDLNTSNGGVVLEYVADDGAGQSWSGYIFATAATTGSLALFSDAVYDLVAVHTGGTVDTVSRGPAMLIPRVTVL